LLLLACDASCRSRPTPPLHATTPLLFPPPPPPTRHLPSFPTRRSSDLKGHHISHLHLAVVDAVGAVPHDQHGYPVHNQHHDRHQDRKSTRLNSSHVSTSYAVFCLKKKTNTTDVIGGGNSRGSEK